MDCWKEIKNLSVKTIETLDRGNSFDVVVILEQSLIVRPHSSGKERIIARNEVDGSYRELIVRGEITRSDIQERYSPRNPAYVAALLESLPNIKYSLKPIRLHLIRE